MRRSERCGGDTYTLCRIRRRTRPPQCRPDQPQSRRSLSAI
ncbi:MAG: hypothetical protein ACK559_40200 [bacterium]